MCILCEMGFSPQTLLDDPMAADGVFDVTNTGVQNTDAILIGTRWDSTALTYTFPTVNSYYTDNPYEIRPGTFDQGYVDNFVAFTASMQTAARTVMDMFGAVSGLTLTEIAPSTATPADIVFAQTNDTSVATANGRFPGYGPNEGHQWYRDSNYDDVPVRGTYTWHTIIHETGHTMGLAHGHNPDSISGSFTGMALTADRNSSEFSIMTYHTFIGDTTPGSTNETFGYAQTLMMYDIAALQALYGANFGENAGDNTYTWSETTGEMFIDGVGQGAAGANRIFMTLWDGNGVDTFDLSNYDSGVSVDLSPGGWSLFDTSQLSNLGSGNYARGNVFNALLFNDNSQSLIDNVIAGDGNDLVVGNRISNTLSGNDGDDTLIGAGGSDTLYGGADNDVIYGDAQAGVGSGVTLSGSGTITHGNIYDTMGTALDVTGLFAQSTDANVEQSAASPHVTLRYSDAAAGPTQWYAITLNAGSSVTFDIDATINLDSFINIFDASGTRLIYSDDNAGDTGSSSSLDSMIANTVTVTGTYFIEVGSFATSTTNGPLGAGDGYDLHITVVAPQDLGGDGVAGDDFLYGGTGDDLLVGGDGADTLDGGLDDDLLYGGDGADWLQGNSGNDTIHGGTGNDEIRGGQGNDVLFGEGGIDTMYGARGDDRLDGGLHDDLLYGGDGADWLQGNSGNDTIYGGIGNDEIRGGQGNDVLFGEDDIDTMYGAAGDDRLDGGLGADLLYGGDGADWLQGNSDNDTIYGGTGNDEIRGGHGDDRLYGEDGIDVMYGARGADWMAGGLGDDRLDGGLDDDRIFGGNGADWLQGNSGNDTLFGGAGNDDIRGGQGDDILSGGDDDDEIRGALGNDTMSGNAGADTFVFTQNFGADLVLDYEVGTDMLSLDDALWGGGLTAAEVISTYARADASSNVVLVFGGDHVTLQGVTSTAGLDLDLLIF